MDLKNGYKVIYDVAKDGERSFYASESGKFEGADLIATATIGEYKLIYEKDGQIFGSATGIPAAGDHCFAEFNKVFAEAEEPAPVKEETPVEEPKAEPAKEEPEVPTEPEDTTDAGDAVENPDEE